MYHLDGNLAYAARARAELLAISNFADWQPSNFLSTGVMITAAAIGYDWLYDYLSISDRQIVKNAIRTKGLDPGLATFIENSIYGFHYAKSNWNIVCNSGLILGALAIAEDDYSYAASIIDYAITSMKNVGMPMYHQDGSWHEGSIYWAFATNFAVQAMAALETSLGSDLGLSNVTAGFAQTGFFRIYYDFPDGTFNFADAARSMYSARAPALFWLDSKFSQPLFSLAERNVVSWNLPNALDLIWFSPAEADLTKLPLNTVFQDNGIAMMRTSWTSPKTACVGFKGGDPNAGHGHHDTGSFVYYADGTRWAYDLGPESYDVPGYFSPTRYSVFRASSYSHNKVMLVGLNESTTGFAPVMKLGSNDKKSWVSMNLTSMWPVTASYFRGIVLGNDGSIIIQDEINSFSPVTVVWSMQTLANLTSKNQLSMYGKLMNFTVLEPANAIVEMVKSRSDPSPAVSTAGFHTLRIRLPQSVQSTRIVVKMSNPLLDPSNQAASITPISSWTSGWTPSANPTSSPSVPTSSPTFKPSLSPTKSPTSKPSSVAPTKLPTLAPTKIPTTRLPMALPTLAPLQAAAIKII